MSETKSITERWEQAQIDREDELTAKLHARDHWSKRRAKVNQRFAIKWHIESLPFVKKLLAKWILNNWFEEQNREDSCVVNSEGCFAYPEVHLND